MATTLSQAGSLLPFHQHILETVHDPSTSDLIILARGLGLRRVVCTLLQIYDGPQNLVLLVNASPEEEASIGEQLGIMGCRKPGLRVVGYEMGRKERQVLYKQGGLISVTSRILVVDMLQADIPTEMITALIVLHAEKVTALSLEAFIIRLFREKNSAGCVKAFSDAPEHITSGFYPLKAIMKELQLSRVHIYPRFHVEIKRALERRRADVVELYQGLSGSMQDIHHSIVQCMTATLAELKRSNTTLELDDLNIENAYFRSFDAIARRQLDPVWHKVGPKTKQLVGDLATLRNLLNYLLSYDPLAFHAYLETLIASNSATATGGKRQHQSPWLFMDAAHTIFQTAKHRCYISAGKRTDEEKKKELKQTQYDVELVDDEDAWAALDEVEGLADARESRKNETQSSVQPTTRKKWHPKGMEPVLEELPKWSLLADVLQEIEEEMVRLISSNSSLIPGTDTVLVMCSNQRTCEVLSDYLGSLDRHSPRGKWGHRMMERRLHLYLWWKAKLTADRKEGVETSRMPGSRSEDVNSPRRIPGADGNVAPGVQKGLSEALKRKDALMREKSMSRRRVRGGAPGLVKGTRSSEGETNKSSETISTGLRPSARETGLGPKERERLGILSGESEMRAEADDIADFLSSQNGVFDVLDNNEDDDVLREGTEPFDRPLRLPTINVDEEIVASMASGAYDNDFDSDYGLLSPEQMVLFHVYSDDTDDQVLDEIKPRFIIMYEPNQDFIRRIECYRSSNPGLAVRVYFMIYQYSCEEHKFLAGIRREKEAFERLIKERGNMVIALTEDRRTGSTSENIIKTISTRIAGGKQVATTPSQVIVDMREFRSTLPSLLHASKLLVIPATLTVGDYILAPDICVERKSIPDLVQSFSSGRLYTQCELMSVHYKQPILLIEFEEHKSFSLDIVDEIKSHTKYTGKYPVKKQPTEPPSDAIVVTSIQSKLVLLTLSFPRLRILWSSSPYATADIFNDLKLHHMEPDAAHAITVGAEEDPEAGAGVNQAAEELLRALPGITAKNVKYVMSKVGTVREFSGLSLPDVQDILGNEPGKACWEFMHRGE